MLESKKRIKVFCDLDGSILQGPPSFGSLFKLLSEKVQSKPKKLFEPQLISSFDTYLFQHSEVTEKVQNLFAA